MNKKLMEAIDLGNEERRREEEARSTRQAEEARKEQQRIAVIYRQIEDPIYDAIAAATKIQRKCFYITEHDTFGGFDGLSYGGLSDIKEAINGFVEDVQASFDSGTGHGTRLKVTWMTSSNA